MMTVLSRQAMSCRCTRTFRCAVAWDLRDALIALPYDGTEARRVERRAIVLEYTAHLQHAGLVTTGAFGVEAWPFWLTDEKDPRIDVKA